MALLEYLKVFAIIFAIIIGVIAVGVAWLALMLYSPIIGIVLGVAGIAAFLAYMEVCGI